MALAVSAGLAVVFSSVSPGQEQAGWRISPEIINVQAGESRTLQVLDNRAQALRGTVWSLDTNDLAEIREENGRAVVQSKAPGTVRVTAVLGEKDLGFTTRGCLLIAFNTREGKELWRWDARVRGVEVFAALADGSCLVQTPTALVAVHGPAEAREVMKGKALMGWNGQIYRKHN